MAIKSSGALSFATDIVGEFADTVPHSMSEFYGGGSKVPAGANPGVATSGAINFNSFYDCVAATVLTISSNTNDYDIGTACIAAGGDKSTPVILTINSGVTVGSTASTIPAIKTGTGWSNGTTITITNNGSIVGYTGINVTGSAGPGGHAGRGGEGSECGYGINSGTAGSSGSNGSSTAHANSNGGNAFEHSQTADNYLSVTFDTAGTRTGGSAGTTTNGGGGGGGGGGAMSQYVINGRGGGGGGGGGAGVSGGNGGTLGRGAFMSLFGGGTCDTSYNGSNGGVGSSSSGASGGGGGSSDAGDGGTGGGLQSAGGSGQSSSGGANSGSAGGSGGSASSPSGTAGSALSGNTGQIS